ncbi:MAG: beta family protein [Anaerolineaceae bacterium]|jgi:hypothetical protein
MTLDNQIYIPCLRWKLGEYKALELLSTPVRELITPIIDVAEIGFDFETHEEIKTIDKHLAPFAKRVRKKWGTKECFIDMHHIDENQRLANGMHPITFVFNSLRQEHINAIPVTGLFHDPQWQNAIKQVIEQNGNGLCFRIDLETALKPDLEIMINGLLQKLHSQVTQCDLIIDEKAPNFEPIEGFVSFLVKVIKKIPYLNQWRSLGLIGTSLPASLSKYGTGTTYIARNEWRAYKLLQGRLKLSGLRIPIFGDYGIDSPETLRVDPRYLRTTANIRYTIDDGWFIVRGQNIKDYGLEQHRDLCLEIINSEIYKGPNFSIGDKYLYDCAQGLASTGNLTTWRWVGTNHHLEMVGREVANFVAS